jgi:hypothetical protein
MGALLARRAGILVPGSGVWAQADTSTKRQRVSRPATFCSLQPDPVEDSFNLD